MKPAILGLILPFMIGVAFASNTPTRVTVAAATRAPALICSALERSAGIEQGQQRVAFSNAQPPAALLSQPAFATVPAAQALADKLVGAWMGAFREQITGTITFEGNGRVLVKSGPLAGMGTYRVDFAVSPARLDIRGDWMNWMTMATIVAFFDDDAICIENMPAGRRRPETFGRNAVMLTRQGTPWSPEAQSTATARGTSTPGAIGTPRPTPTRRPTATPRPTRTPRPSSTPRPTPTMRPGSTVAAVDNSCKLGPGQAGLVVKNTADMQAQLLVLGDDPVRYEFSLEPNSTTPVQFPPGSYTATMIVPGKGSFKFSAGKVGFPAGTCLPFTVP